MPHKRNFKSLVHVENLHLFSMLLKHIIRHELHLEKKTKYLEIAKVYCSE